MEIGSAIIDHLVDRDITTIFGIPGKQTLPLNRAIEQRDDVEFLMARHETAVSHNAWGYAESSDEMAATVVIPGPGDMNAMNGLKNALNDCTPVLHIAVETEHDIRGGDGIHETPPETYSTVVKENILVQRPHGTVVELDRAIRIARTPPCGPVRIGIPKDFLQLEVPLATPGPVGPTHPMEPSTDAVDEAATKLASADRPVIIAGGGIRRGTAEDELRAVAERLGAPVLTTYKGKGVFPADHDLFAGMFTVVSSVEALSLVAESDVALGVGTDFDAVNTKSWTHELPPMLVHVTIDPSDIGVGYEPTVGIVADAKRTLDVLDDELASRSLDGSTGTNRAATVREVEADRLAGLSTDRSLPLTSVDALQALRQVTPRDAIVTADAGGSRLWTLHAFPTYNSRNYINPGSWASMGTSLPSAIGAKVANPERDVVSVTGDGGLMMCIHELHTLVDEGIDVTVVVLNNNDYAIISEEATRSYDLDDQEYGWPTASIDFTTIAEGFGLAARRPITADDVEDELEAAIDSSGPTLVEIPSDPDEPQAGEWMTADYR